MTSSSSYANNLTVWVKRGICSADSIINILLCVLGYVRSPLHHPPPSILSRLITPQLTPLPSRLQLPGLLHAWYIIAKHPEPDYDYEYQNVPQDPEHGRVYVFVNGQPQPRHQGYQQHPIPHAQGPKPQQQAGQLNYGTANNYNHNSGSAGTQQQHQPQEQGTTSEAGPSDGAAPPSYAQVVAGDHKVQTHD